MKPAMKIDIGKSIRKWRLSSGMSQESLANELGVSQPKVVLIESGRCRITIPLMIKILEILRPNSNLLKEFGRELK